MTRQFTPAELYQTTQAEFKALSPADQHAFTTQLVQFWTVRSAEVEALYLSGDLDQVTSYRRFSLGE